MASTPSTKSGPDSPKAANLGNLRLIWTMAMRYPGRLVGAGIALLAASGATLAIPSGFKLVIDRGFAGGDHDIGRWFQYLLFIVVILAIATASRFYFV